MNKDNAHLYLPLVQALADGKVIQRNEHWGWADINDPALTCDPSKYRIKPEPKMAWYRVAELNGENCIVPNSTVFSEGDEENLSLRPYFKRWLTERITYEVTE